jgi:hypothetical protein
MARAVATLEGDSSSLVDAIDKAKGSMTKLESEGRKLTDQLRDVADEADKAAGALVNKIGGPTAIKAIAGVSAAFAGANVALDALSGSMSAFYATQGDKGAKAMADIDTALNTLSSTLFTAVMGTDDMEEITRTLISGIETLTTVVDALLTPLQWMGQFLKLLRDFGNENADATRKQNDELVKLKATQDQMKKSYDSNQTAIEGNLKAVRALTGATEDGRKASLRAALTATDAIAAQVQLAEKEQDIADYKRLANAEEEENDRKARDIASQQLAAHQIKQEEFESKSNQYFNTLQTDTRRAALATVMVMSEATKTQLQSLGAQRQVLASELLGVTNQMKTEAEGATNTPTKTATGRSAPAAAPPELTGMAKQYAEMDALFAEGAAKQAAAEAQALGDGVAAYVAAERAKVQANADRIEAEDAQAKAVAAARRQEFGDASSAEISAYLDAKTQKEIADQAEFDAARQRAIELHDLTFNFQQTAADFAAGERAKEKAAHDEKVNAITAGFQEYGKLAGQQLANGEKAGKIAEKLAKKAIGAQISALGDQAMIKAAAYAAELNPLAFPMAAAGVAAYTAAAALGAEGKKATAATPAAAAPAAAPVNTSFNLRVDAAFADGESIARQFAMLQKSAQRRGLVPAGA